ncbi:MAG: thioredoxin family protein [Candidatus Micrarchaeia archaeon]
MVKRKLSVKIYLVALILTIIVFMIGVYVGGIANITASEGLLEKMEDYYTKSNLFEIMLLSGESPSFCPLYLEELENLETKTIKLGEELDYLETVKGVYDENLKKNYFLLELKSYLLFEKVNSLCKTDKTIILYFYSKDCPDCILQGKELDLISEQMKGKIRIYSFDGSISSSAVESIKERYNITNYPSLVINGNKEEGLKNKNEINNIINKG